MDNPSDEDLMMLAIAGNRREFGLIWDRHHGRVFRHLAGQGHDRWTAEDLTATVFFELWRRRGSVRFVDGSALPWMIVTAQHVSQNARRARRRYWLFLSRLPRPEPAPDPADEVESKESLRIGGVRSVMDSLKLSDRQLLAMTAVEGMSVSEAAQALGISHSAAKMRLSRLRAKLSVQGIPQEG